MILLSRSRSCRKDCIIPRPGTHRSSERTTPLKPKYVHRPKRKHHTVRAKFACHSVNEAKEKIIECEKEFVVIDEINCDHDLGDYASDGGDGIKLIDWLAERETYYPVRLHTMNPVGRENMQREIDRYWNKNK